MDNSLKSLVGLASLVISEASLDERPVLQTTRTSRRQDNLTNRFNSRLFKITRFLLTHNWHKLTFENKRRLSLLFLEFITKGFTVGQEYSTKSKGLITDQEALQKIAATYTQFATQYNQLFAKNSISSAATIQFEDDPFPLFPDFYVIDLEDLDFDEIDVDDLVEEFPELDEEFDLDFDTISKARSTVSRITSDSITKSLNQGTLSQATIRVQFVTRRDSIVCPICEDLDGEEFDVDPTTKIVIDGPTIPDDLHPNCRCRYLNIDTGEELDIE